MLSPDTETRMLLACYLHGDTTLEKLKHEVMKVAWRLDRESVAEHPLTSQVILALYDDGFGARTEVQLRLLFEDLFRASGPSKLDRRGKVRLLVPLARADQQSLE